MTQTDFELGRASVNCLPRGVPGMFLINPYPFQIVQTPGLFVQLDELNNNFRVVHTDGRAHNPDPDPSFDGDGVAHWDGDTLVIDTIAIDERTWNNFTGWFHSDQEHVLERVSRPSLNYLNVVVTTPPGAPPALRPSIPNPPASKTATPAAIPPASPAGGVER